MTTPLRPADVWSSDLEATEPGRMDLYYLRRGRRAFRPGSPRLKVMADLCRGPRVLDVGCGTGDLLLRLQEAEPSWQLCGTEISLVALGVCVGRGVDADLLWTAGVPAGPWHTIVMGQVLEHLADDIALIEAASEQLAMGGRLLVSVPNQDQVASPDHKREYDAKLLAARLRRVGLVRHIHWSGEATRLIMWAGKGDTL